MARRHLPTLVVPAEAGTQGQATDIHSHVATPQRWPSIQQKMTRSGLDVWVPAFALGDSQISFSPLLVVPAKAGTQCK
jgi:hypothetical protein